MKLKLREIDVACVIGELPDERGRLQNLRVNAVAPGSVLPPTDVREKAGEALLDHRPTPEDVAAAVAYLLAAEATTGSVIPVDGGQNLLG